MNLLLTATYGNRRTELAKNVRQGIILLPGNNDAPMNFRDKDFLMTAI
jgi:hypothetical protein